VGGPLDLGHGHTLRWMTNRDDDGRPFSAVVKHERAASPTGFCEGAITTVNAPEAFKVVGGRPTSLWQVESWEPLTLSPSLLCHCGDHGFIREGRWVPA
jgi:hypothetical protein